MTVVICVARCSPVGSASCISPMGLNSPATATSCSLPTPQPQHMSFQGLITSVLPVMGKHCDQSSERPQPNKASSQPSRPTSTTSSLLAVFRGRESNTPQTTPSPTQPSASENPTPTAIQPLARDPSRPARATRVPAVTSKAMTTAPVRDKSRPHRRKYPTNMRQRH